MSDEASSKPAPIVCPLFDQSTEQNAAIIGGISRIFEAVTARGNGPRYAIEMTEAFVETISRLQKR